jgi:phenylalanine-4-hydroxylase
VLGYRHIKTSFTTSAQKSAVPKISRNTPRKETALYFLRGRSSLQQIDRVTVADRFDHTSVVDRNVWQVLDQRPSRLAQGWRYGKAQ